MMQMTEQKKTRGAYLVLVALLGFGMSGISARAATSNDDDMMSLLGASVQTSQEKSAGQTWLKSLLGAKPTAEQNIFLGFFEKGELEKAIFQWPAAFDNTEFSKTANGRAIYGYLQFRNGLAVTGIETLFQVAQPDSVSPDVLKLWKEAASDTHPAWNWVQVKWMDAWTKVFGVGAETRVLARQLIGSDQTEVIKEMLKKTAADTRERAILEWQLVVALGLKDEAGQAAKLLNHLMTAKNNPVGQDLLQLTAARLLYQNGYLDAAAKYYQLVKKDSDYWFEAQEELAWTYTRKGEPQNTLAVTRSLVVPSFAQVVGPESIFLQSLAQLKVCDYPGVAESLKMFRERFKSRVSVLSALRDNVNSVELKRFLDMAMKTGRVGLKDLGADAAKLPRMIARDELLSQLVSIQVALEKEAKVAADLYARSLSGGTAQVGFQARIESMKTAVDARAQVSKTETLNRVKTIAGDEIAEISATLQKMQIVETELIQQISKAERVIQASRGQPENSRKGTTGSLERDRISFLADKEVWFDEIGNYKIDLKKGCQARK